MNNTIKRTWNQGSMVNIEDLRGMTFQAESGGHTFVISAVDADGNAVSLSGTPAGTMLRPDNTDQALTCSISGGKVYATLPAGCYDVPGRAGITIFLTSNSQKVAIYAAVVSVTRTQSGTASPGTTASVVDLVNAINTAISGIPATDTALKAAMAPTYSNSALYAVGEYAWYNGTLYRCTTAITTAETWTSGHWTAAAIGTDSANGLRELKSALYNQLVEIDFAPALSTDRKIAPASGKSATDAKYTRTGVVQAAKGERAAVGLISNIYEFAVFYYGPDGSISTGEDYLNRYTEYGNGIVLLPEDVANFGLSFRRKDNADLTSTDRDAIKAAVKAYMFTDISLSKKNYAADAKAVQDALSAGETATENKLGDLTGVSFSVSQGLKGCFFETDGEDYIYLKALNTWYLRGAVATSESYGNILTESKVTSPSGVADCIKLASNDAVVYDTSDSTWKIVSLTSDFSSDYIPIFVSGYFKGYKQYGIVKGIGQYLYLAYSAKKSGENYEEEISTLVRKVLADRDNRTITFGLITDSHHGQKISGTSVNYNAIAQADIFNRTCEKCADFTVHLGDAIGGMKALSVNTGYLTEYAEAQNDTFLPFMYTIGHHEMYGQNYLTDYLNDPTAIPMANVLGAVGKRKFISPVYSESGDNWYFDLDGIRFISIDSVHNSSNGFNGEAKTFLQTAVNTENKIIVFAHLPANAGVNWNKRAPNSGSNIEATLNGATAQVLAYLHGHTHWDNTVVVEGNSFPYIATCCAFADKMDSSKFCDLGNPTVYDRVIGDYSEFCFDIVNVHADTGTIKHFRFGVGNDRTYTQPT